MIIHENFSLKSYNTFGIDAKTKYFATFDRINTLKEILKIHKNTPKIVLGEGSNILFTKDFEGIILKNEIKFIDILLDNEREAIIKVGAGENWAKFVQYCVQKGYYGIENLALIPGLVGASPIQNIGAYGVEVKDFIVEVETFDVEKEEICVFGLEKCQFGYRESIFKKTENKKYIITSVKFHFSKTPNLKLGYGDIKKVLTDMHIEQPTPQDVHDAVCQIRLSKLPNPAEIGNAGSFFKNPEIDFAHFEYLKQHFAEIPHFPTPNPQKVKVPAGWLIEKAGWKGKKVGNVGVHHKQALVLVNHGQGTGAEILALSNEIQKSVSEMFGIGLVAEVNFL